MTPAGPSGGEQATAVVRPVPPCPACGECHLEAAVAAALHCCPGCGHHHRIGARARIAQLLDGGQPGGQPPAGPAGKQAAGPAGKQAAGPAGKQAAGPAGKQAFEEWDRELRPRDPLEFVDLVPYRDRLHDAQARTGLHDALITGRGAIEGRPVGVAVMDFGFIGGSMGEVVGERVARAMERSAAHAIPFIAVAASGGARMQEGLLSLMQMAKTSIARTRLAEVPVPYVTVLTNPTMGGVMASFAATADVVLAEPGATVGFAGARVITQATHEALPAGFQTSEFMLDHGFVDRVVPRAELREAIGRLLALYPLPRAMPVTARREA